MKNLSAEQKKQARALLREMIALEPGNDNYKWSKLRELEREFLKTIGRQTDSAAVNILYRERVYKIADGWFTSTPIEIAL